MHPPQTHLSALGLWLVNYIALFIKLSFDIRECGMQYSPHKKAVPERTLRFGTATDFAIESAAVEGGYSKPTYVFVPRV